MEHQSQCDCHNTHPHHYHSHEHSSQHQLQHPQHQQQHQQIFDISDLQTTPRLRTSQNMASLVRTNSNISSNTNMLSSTSNINNLYPNITSTPSHTSTISSFTQQDSPSLSNSTSKHLYHNLYSSPTKQEMKMFIPPLHNNNSHNQIDGYSTPTKNLPYPPVISKKSEEFMPPLNEKTGTRKLSSTSLHSTNLTSNTFGISTNKNDKIIPDFNNNSDIFSSPAKQNKAKKLKICKVCSKPIIGTLVRAMGNVYHVDCFTCYDCHKPCSDKFFAADIKVDLNGTSITDTIENREDTNNNDTDELSKDYKIINVPLCEYDYFRRIDLICYTCKKAIRGSYITALGRKYHPEHFYCEICHKVFESDNYYAYDGKIYCHYHYSKLHAYHCESCGCAILKQYVEIFRGGKQQQWHPECFMVHKFWNVDIKVDALGLNINSIDEISSNPDKLYKVETSLEKLTISIWLTLSEFEESCASLISEMLHTATTNNKSKGLIVTSKLIYKIRCLFKSIESLFKYSNSKHILLNYQLPKYQHFSQLIKEPRSLTSKIMSYLTFLRDIDSEKLTVNKYSHELLSLISTIAHFIKLISRNALIHALEFNKSSCSLKPTEILLNEIAKHENYPLDITSLNTPLTKLSDSCSKCNKSIEDDCILFQINESHQKRWHLDCFRCSKCPNNPQIPISDISESAFNIKNDEILCPSCASGDVNAHRGFQLVSRFMQLAYLLEIAIMRSKIVMDKRERKIHQQQLSDTSFTNSVESEIDNNRNTMSSIVPSVRRVSLNDELKKPPNTKQHQLKQNLNSINQPPPSAASLNHHKNKQGLKDGFQPSQHGTGRKMSKTSNFTNQPSGKDSYENKVTEIARRRSLREARQLNTASREVRKSVIIEAPVASSASTEEIIDGKKNNNNAELGLNDNINSNINNSSLQYHNSVRTTSSKGSSNIPKSKSFRNGYKGSKKLRIEDIPITNRQNSRSNNDPRNRKDQINMLKYQNNNKKAGPFNAALTSKLLQNESSLTLDDIPRIVSSEQAREHRPNAFRFQRRDYSSAISTLPVPKVVKTKDSIADKSVSLPSTAPSTHLKTKYNIGATAQNSMDNLQNMNIPALPLSATANDKKNAISSFTISNVKRYSEFSRTSHEYIRHIAAFALHDLFSNKMTLEECAGMIDVKKSLSFWGKLFGSGHESESKSSNAAANNSEFKSGSATIAGSGKGVFGVSLNVLIQKYGVDSDLGVGTHKVRIPLLIDELINVMRTQDVSVEGVFRVNGNIKRLRQLVEAIESHPERIPKLENETPIQLAAVLKKFLRDLPIPLLTFKLYELFLLSQRLGTGPNVTEDDAKLARKRVRVLKLAYAMLPKPNRDLTEVILAFLSWVSTFANIDDDDNITGSKMDTHNLATVITPNILYANIDNNGTDALGLVNSVGGDNQFLAIEVVNEMIEMNDELSIIPDDLYRLYKLAGFDKDVNDKDGERGKGKDRDREKDKNIMLTKDIMAKLKTVVESNPGVLQKF